MDLLKYWESLTEKEQIEQFDEIISQLNKDDEKDRKTLLIIWRESASELRDTISSGTFEKMIDLMKEDSRRLMKLWYITPEETQLRESNILDKILQYESGDTKSYISTWKYTSPKVQEQYQSIVRKMDILDKLKAVNNSVIETLDIGMLDERFTSTLSLEQLQMITSYPKEQKSLIGLTKNQYEVLNRSVNGIDDIQQWKYEFCNVLTNINDFDGLVEDIIQMQNNGQDIDYHKVLMVLQQKNYYNVQSYNDIDSIAQKREQQFEEVKNNIGNRNLPSKKMIVLEHLYNIDNLIAEDILKKYGTDILELADNEENSKLKEIISRMKRIIEAEREEELSEFFDILPEKDLDNITLELRLKQSYNEEYNSTLTQVSQMQEASDEEKSAMGLEGMNVYNAGVDFNILMTSIAPYNANRPKNYCEDWNRKETQSQGFCCSYIRNDMLGHAPVPNLCYGFSSMESGSLILSGVDDIASNTSDSMLESSAYNNVKFYAPNNQIDKVFDESYYRFNEMVYNRVQNGTKKQPDFIVAFMKDGVIPNSREIKSASQQFKEKGIDLPIVIIDEDKCIASEKGKLDNMIEQFKQNPTQELFSQINQKAKNNSVAHQSEFYQYSNYIYNNHERMKEVVESKRAKKDSVSEWNDRCKHWYEFSDKLPENAKGKFLELKNKVMQKIKSILTREKQGEKVFTNDERDE